MSPLSKDETAHGSSFFTQNSPDKPRWLSGRYNGSGTPPPPPPHKPMLAEWTRDILSLSPPALDRPASHNDSNQDASSQAIAGSKHLWNLSFSRWTKHATPAFPLARPDAFVIHERDRNLFTIGRTTNLAQAAKST